MTISSSGCLIALINTQPDLAVIGETDDGDQAIALFEKLKPALVLMDVRMPRRSGTEATRHIRQMSPATRVLMLSAFDGDADIHTALEAGAHGYVLKSATGEELIPAIRAVAAGKRWIPRDVPPPPNSPNPYQHLTP